MSTKTVRIFGALYRGLIGSVDNYVPRRLQPFWQSPTGPRTIFFWGPICKWGLILAGLGDIINRPIQNVSLTQCGTIATTALIWSRWSLVIKPKNYNLFTVNIFIFLTQAFLILRVLYWRKKLRFSVQTEIVKPQIMQTSFEDDFDDYDDDDE